jgi:UrcA family protein
MNSRNAFRPSVLFGAALAAALLSSTSFAADRPGTVPVVTVRYTQTELSNTSGATNVYARIRNAARMVCGDSGRSLDEQRIYRSCYHATIEAAVADVHSPLLETVYHAQEHRQPYTAMLVR